jgi:hypothetical protein
MAHLGAIVDDLLGAHGHANGAADGADRALGLIEELLAACEALELAGEAARARELHARVTTWQRDLDRLLQQANTLVEQGYALTAPGTAAPSAPDRGPGERSSRTSVAPPPRPAHNATESAPVPEWARRAGQALPVRSRASPTQGQVFDTAGRPLSSVIRSSSDRTLITDLTLNVRERHSMSLLSHVEAKVAAQVRHGTLPQESTLVINNEVCKGELGCDVFLPSILPRGARLTVYVTDDAGTRLHRVYEGTGSRIAR